MERILKLISDAGSDIEDMLLEPRDQKKLDRIVKKFDEYASIFPCCLNCELLTQHSRSLKEENKKIKAMLKQGLGARMASNIAHAGELVSSSQAVKVALDTFLVSCFKVVFLAVSH